MSKFTCCGLGNWSYQSGSIKSKGRSENNLSKNFTKLALLKSKFIICFIAKVYMGYTHIPNNFDIL
jgi:hypothetical protein